MLMKRIAALLAAAMLALVTPLSAASPAKMAAYVDQNNQSFMPVGFLKSYEGVSVKVVSAENKIEISKNETHLTMHIGRKTALVNGKETSLKAAPFRENGTVYVPLPFVSRHLNLALAWQKDSSSVDMTLDEKSLSLPVQRGKIIPASEKAIVTARKTFKVGSRSMSAQTVTISLLHPKVELDVAMAGNKAGNVEDLKSLAKRNRAVVAINGTFFDAYSNGSYKAPYGYVFGGGQMLKDSPGDRRTVFTFDQNHLARLIPGLDFKGHYSQYQVKGAVQAGPRLLVDGKISLNVTKEGFKDPKILTGGGARSALGITRDHKLILLTTGSATIPQLAEMMKQAGAYQAMNLDGGASSGLYYNGSYLTVPGRQISNAIIVRLK